MHSDSTVSIGNVTVKASQADGDSATGQVSLSVLDDRPDAVDDAAREVAEDAAGAISGNVLTNDTPGADGASLTHVELPGGGGFVAITTGAQGPDRGLQLHGRRWDLHLQGRRQLDV